MSEASELFGAVASAYARHRLTYPEAFFDTSGQDPLPPLEAELRWPFMGRWGLVQQVAGWMAG